MFHDLGILNCFVCDTERRCYLEGAAGAALCYPCLKSRLNERRQSEYDVAERGELANPRYVLTDEMRDRILTMHRGGMQNRDIADVMGLNRITVGTFLFRHKKKFA